MVSVFRLLSGMDIIGEIVEGSETSGVIVVKNAFGLMAHPSPEGMRIGFVPLKFLGVDGNTGAVDLTLPESALLMSPFEANGEVSAMYLTRCTGIEIPKQGRSQLELVKG